MPKLPLIQAEEPLPRRIPYSGPDGDVLAAPARALQYGAEKIGAAAQQIGAQAQARLDKEREVEDLVAAAKLRTRFGTELAKLDVELRNSNDFDIKTHSERLSERGQQLLDQIASEAAYPTTGTKFRVSAQTALGEKVINAKYEYANHLEKEGIATNLALRSTLESEAVGGAEVLVGVKTDQYERATRSLIGRGIDAAQAEKLIQEFKEQVWTQRAQAEIIANPTEGMAKLVEKNADGSWKYYPGLDDKARNSLQLHSERLAEWRADQQRQAEDRAERKLKEQQREQYEGTMSDLTQKARTRNLTLDELWQARTTHRLKAHDADFLYKVLTAPPDELPSNAAVLAMVNDDVHRPAPRLTHDDLRRMRLANMQNPGTGLTQSDHDKAAAKLTEGQKYWRGETKDERRYGYSRAVDIAETQMRVDGPGALQLTEGVQAIKGAFLDELTRRVHQGKEDPDAVRREIIPKYLKLIGEETQLQRHEVLGLMELPADITPQQLLAMRRQHEQMQPPRNSDGYYKWQVQAERYIALSTIDSHAQKVTQSLATSDADAKRPAAASRRMGSPLR
jgi:hypothetical protein